MNSRNGRLWLTCLAATTSTLVVLTSGVAAAEPNTPPISAPAVPERRLIKAEADLHLAQGVNAQTLALMRTQEGLNRLADQLRTANAREGTAESGLAGIVVEPEKNVLRLYWKGTLPATANNAIAEGKAAGITVRTTLAPYTETQLQSEIARMVGQSAAAAGAKQRIVEAGPKPDGTGINVTVAGVPAGITTPEARAAVPALNSAIPLTITAGDAPQVAARWIDPDPHWGGAFITTGGSSCSNAFGVTGLNGAATYMLTAWHCGPGTWRTGEITYPEGPFSYTLGNVIERNAIADDAEAIHTPAGSDGTVYYGPPINPPNNDLGASGGIAVGGSSTSTVGDLVCTDGAFTGTVCSVRVAATGLTVTAADHNGNIVATFTNMINAQLPGVSVAGNGDSGGPVFAIRTGDQRAIARGIISSIATGPSERPCTGFVSPGRRCSMSVYYGDINRAMNTIGVRINTA